MSLTKFVGLLAGSTLTLTSVSYGATEANNDTATQLSELKAEIAALKAQQGEQWLTEQRAAQVRGIVQDVLAHADTRASLQNTGATSGYDNGFFISSADGNFKLKITALEQVRFVYNNNRLSAGNPDTRENVWGFENRRTQMWFTGNVVDQSWTYAGKGDPVTGQATYPELELVRLALPRRVYTNSHLSYVAESVVDLLLHRDALGGLVMTYEASHLRHFTARFEEESSTRRLVPGAGLAALPH